MVSSGSTNFRPGFDCELHHHKFRWGDRLIRGCQGYRRGAEPSGTNRLSRPRLRAKSLSRASMNGDSRSIRSAWAVCCVNWSSARSVTPPPSSPATRVQSRRTIHQHLPRLSSGTDASSRMASASSRGSNASCSNRSNLATTLAAQRQNLQSPSYSNTGRCKRLLAPTVDSEVSNILGLLAFSRPLLNLLKNYLLAAG